MAVSTGALFDANPLGPKVFRVLGSEACRNSRSWLYFPDKKALLPGNTYFRRSFVHLFDCKPKQELISKAKERGFWCLIAREFRRFRLFRDIPFNT